MSECGGMVERAWLSLTVRSLLSNRDRKPFPSIYVTRGTAERLSFERELTSAPVVASRALGGTPPPFGATCYVHASVHSAAMKEASLQFTFKIINIGLSLCKTKFRFLEQSDKILTNVQPVPLAEQQKT